MCESKGGKIVLDLQKVYREISGGNNLPITSIAIKEDLNKELAKKIDKILRENFFALLKFPDTFSDKASEILNMEKSIIKSSLKRLSFRYVGVSAKKVLISFLKFILEKEPKLIDGKLPGEEFYKI